MIINCGPKHDIRQFSLELPKIRKRLGVLVSGGIDSTLLYYLLLYLNKENNASHIIKPFTVLRNEGAKYFAKPMVNHVHRILGLPESFSTIVGDTTLPEPEQVKSGVENIIQKLGYGVVYIGAISLRPEHLINIEKPITIETPEVRFPLLNLEKSHVIDLYYKLGIESILQYTHSCNTSETEHCGFCNGCTERIWGFTELGLDPV